MILDLYCTEAAHRSPSKDASSESDMGNSESESDESERQPKASYVHPKGRDKAGIYITKSM